MAKATIETGQAAQKVHTRTTAGDEESQVAVIGIDGVDEVVPASVTNGLLVQLSNIATLAKEAKQDALIAAVDGLEGALASLLTELGQKLEAADLAALATAARQDTLIGHVDGVEALATAIRDRLPAALVSGALATAPANAGDVASTLTNGRKTITTAGAAEAIAGSTSCEWVTVVALRTNTDVIHVGGSGVIANAGTQTGIPLEPGEGVTIPVDNANKVFIDVLVNGEGCSYVVGA